MTRRFIVALVCLACVVFSLSCKTGSTAQKQQSADHQAPDVVAVDEGLALAFANDPGVVLKFRLDQVDEIAPALQKLADRAGGTEKQMLEGLIAKDWAELFSMVARKEAPPTLGIDESAPIYVSIGTVGGDRFADAFAYGAPLQPDNALPAALRTRVVVRAESADDLEAALEDTRQVASREDYDLSIRRDGEYLVADYERMRPDLDSRMKLDDEVGSPRQTPAFEEFTASTDPLAVYVRTRQALTYGAAANQYDMSSALESVSPANAMRVVAVSTAVNLNLTALSPPSQRELEDTCIRLAGDGEKMVMLTGLSTQTELGRALASANEEAAIVPSSFAEDANPFAELRVNFDGGAMWDVASATTSETRGGVGSMYGLTRAIRDNGWPGFAAVLFGSPTYVPRLMYHKAQESKRTAMPYAMLLELASPPESDVTPAMRGGGPFPIYGVAVAFEAEGLQEQELGQARELLEVFPTSRGPKTSSQAIERGTLFRATNADSLSMDTKDIELSAGRLWAGLDLAVMLELMGNSDMVKGLEPFDALTADLSLRDTTNRWRVVVGAPGLLAEKVPDMSLEPLAVAPRCVGEALQSRSDLFAGFERLRKHKMGPDEWLDLLDRSGVDPAMKACAEASPEHKDGLQLARARMAEFMVRYARLLEKPDIIEAIRKRGCDLGDIVQCEMLEE